MNNYILFSLKEQREVKKGDELLIFGNRMNVVYWNETRVCFNKNRFFLETSLVQAGLERREIMKKEITSVGKLSIGDEVEIVKMNGEPQYTGKKGTVTNIDDIGNVHGTWGGCALIEGDIVKKVKGGSK